MTWLRVRALPLAGFLCLAGQGLLLSLGGAGVEAPRLPLPGLFLLLTIVVTLASAFAGPRDPSGRGAGLLFWRGLSLLAVATLLGTGIGFLRVGGRQPAPVPDHSVALDRALARAVELEPALSGWWAEVAPGPPVVPDSLRAPGAPARGGDLFRSLDRWPDQWRAAGVEWPCGAVVWQGTDRAAWCGTVEPLAPPKSGPAPPPAPDWRRTLRRGREGWILQQMARLPGGEVLELQVRLTRDGTDELAAGVDMVVGPVDDPALTIDDAGLLISQVGFGPGGGAPYAHLLARPELPAARRGTLNARLLLGALAAWVLALIGLARLAGGTGAALLALWVGRGVLGAAEALRWVGAAFPDQAYPAAPGSWLSLADPAYFATPFAGGWFASTADALLTALVIALTAWFLLQRRGLLAEGAEADEGKSARPLLGPGLTGGLAFGVLSGGVLLVLAFAARLLAENANPRLIGDGISLGTLSFWGLQIVLMLLAFSLAALLSGLIAGARWPGPRERPGWLGGGVLAAVVALLVVTVGPDGWWAARLLAFWVTAGLWFVAPALRARPRFLRRFGWPVVLLLAVCWNYVSLRNVYDAAERTWLESRGRQITEADADWPRFLLGSVLTDMVAGEGGRAGEKGGDNLWKDEAAWRLYRDSALRDLGYQCAVEVIDPAGWEESYFALGFMSATGYEVLSRGPWVDMVGLPTDATGDMIFRLERRRYPGGEEEVLAGEARRNGDRGWIRVDLPVRSWRVATLTESLSGDPDSRLGRYRPRAEVARPVLLMLADDAGWLDTGPLGAPGPEADASLALLRSGAREWVDIRAGDDTWLCLWKALPAAYARSPGEGFLLGLRQPRLRENVLDLSRLMLLDLVLFFLFFVLVQTRRWLLGRTGESGHQWRPGFQERFLGGYLVLGLVLLVLVGMSVDQVGYERVRAEAQERTRAGLSVAVEQLRALLTEQAASLVDSDYMDGLMRGRLSGQRPAGTEDFRQGMVFAGDGELLLDETLSDLSAPEARDLLEAGRQSPMILVRDGGEVFVGAVIPVNLGDWVADPDSSGDRTGHGQVNNNGFFFYRQRLDKGLIRSLAELVSGQITLDVDGQPLLASHPAAIFAGAVPLLADPDKMMPVLDHRAGSSVFAAPGRPFAFTAGRPLPSFSRAADGRLVADRHPAVLNLAFPDREVEYANQRNATVLFLAGLANLILLTALFLALLLSWNIFRPVRLLLTATRSLARGDYQAPLPDAGRDEVGRLAEAFGSMRSQLQTARDELAAREHFLATVLARVTVGVAVIDDADGVVVLNPAGEHILADFMPHLAVPEATVRLLQDFRRLAGEDARVAAELVGAGGRRTLRGALAPLDLPGGRTDTMLVFEDVTEFLTTKKMAINAELTRQVAHEIKNPLTPIQLSVQLLGQAWRDRHPQLERIVPETVERVLEQVSLLRSIASEFSLLGRPGELETEPVDLLDVVRRVTEAYVPGGSAAGAHTVDIDAAALPPVQAHRESLLKILGNLMQNSLDAARPETPLAVSISWRITADHLTLVWRDNGLGLPAEVADRLFDPYFSTKSKGTGLGLVICRNLADRMGGAITLGNRPDGPGAVAELTLPRAGNA